MKKILTASIFLNFLLLAGLLVAAFDRPRSMVPAALSPAAPASAPVATVAVAAAVEPKVVPALFHWNQLDAKDYHVYVKNLRAVDCPEATLRAIVTADVHAAYQFQISGLEKKLQALSTNAWPAAGESIDEEAKLRQRLQAMPAQEAAEIADMLGLKPGPVQDGATEVASASASQGEPGEVKPTAVPLIFQNVDSTAIKLTDEQVEALNNVKQNFMDQIGGANQDPNDPAYLARWQKAQPAADSMLRGMLGNQAYAQYQMAQLMADTQNSQTQ